MTQDSGSTDLNRRPGQSAGHSLDHPAAPGTVVKTKIERGDRYSAPEVYNLEIAILTTIRGEEALRQLNREGISWRTMRQGFEVILARVQIGYFKNGRGLGQTARPYLIERDFFYCTSANGETIFDLPESDPPPADQIIGVSLAPGQRHDGWILLEVPVNERKPLLAFRREYRKDVFGVWPPIWLCL